MSSIESLDFNPYFMLHVLRTCITDTNFASKVLHVISADVFKTKEKKFLFNLVKNYFKEYKESPKDHFYELFEEEKKSLSEKSQKIAEDVLVTMAEIDHTNTKYLLNKIHEALSYISFEDALVEAAQLHKKKKLGEAKNVILKALREPEKVQKTYYDFLKDDSYIEQRTQGKTYKMKSMIKPWDDLIGGFNPTWLIVILAATKMGKTKLLVELAIAGVLQGLNGLFISLEQGKDEIDASIDQAIGFLGDRPGEAIDTMVYNRIKKEWYKTKKVVDTIFDLSIVSKNRRALGRFGGKLFVSDQTGGKFNCHDQEALIEQVQSENNVIFDFVITDYLGEMGVTEKGQKKKERVAENCSGLKGNAKSRNIIQFTAMQANRKAMSSKTVRSDLIGDAIEPIQIADLIWAICQTEKEERENQSRFYVAEYRHGPKHGQVSIVRDLNRGAIALGKGKDLNLKDDEEESNDTEY